MLSQTRIHRLPNTQIQICGKPMIYTDDAAITLSQFICVNTNNPYAIHDQKPH